MTDDGIFESTVRSKGDRAGVFEYDGEVGYFYLYNLQAPEEEKVLAAIRVLTGSTTLGDTDVAIHWDSTETRVGLFILGQLWAAFDLPSGARYGGDYHSGSQPAIPPDICASLSD